MSGSLVPQDHFPVPDGTTYLNSASISLTARPVREEMRRFEDEVVHLGTINLDDEAENRVYEGVRGSAAALLGCDADDIAVMTSATEALCQVAWWLRPGEGENVVSIDIEFPSVTYPWLRLAEDEGLEVRLVRAMEDPLRLTLDRVAELVDERTAAICVSHVQYATGHLLDPTALSELAHAHDALLILDTTQSSGAVPLDVRSTDQDVVIASAYKWLTGVPGAAFAYLRPEVAERFRPPFVGWRTTGEGAMAFDATRISLAEGGRRMEYATVAYEAGISLGAATRYLLDVGIEKIHEHDRGLCALLAEGLRVRGAEPLTPEDPDGRGTIVAARFPGRDPFELAGALARRSVFVAPRLGGLRFSPHLHNDEDDVGRALEALDAALEGA
ncbi:MAG TPA: aminotransferase class V-fold PLP-dependent enzyme [Actinomycetota bacterium]